MHVEPLQPVFSQAAAPTLQRLREDRQRAPRRVQPLLAYLEAHLFDTDLDYQQLKRACGIRDNTMPALFHQAVGMPPATYMRDCRMSTAARLLAESDLKVWQISDLVGYSSLQVFGRAFKRWSKLSPVAYRRKHRRKPTADEGRRRVGPALDLPPATGRKIFRGGLDEAQATEVLSRLVALYPAPGQSLMATAPPLSAPGGAAREEALLRPSAAERALAEDLWQSIEDQGPEEQRAVVRREIDDEAVVPLFHVLCGKSRERGRDNRERGVAIAELALDALQRLPLDTPPRARRHLQALAWANLGNARRLALDLPGARSAGERAERALPSDPDPGILGEILTIQAALRWYEQRPHELLELVERALPLLLAARNTREAARCLNVKAIGLIYLDRHAAAVDELQHAIRILGRKDDVLRYNLLQVLARTYLTLGEVQKAEGMLPTARTAATRLRSPFHQSIHHWLEGSVAHAGGRDEEALQLMTAAREGLEACDATTLVAEISLALALIHAERGESRQAAEAAARGLPLFDALNRHGEAKAAHAVLRRALDEQALDVEICRHLQSSLDRLRKDPTLGLR